jgi:hypothetical protein
MCQKWKQLGKRAGYPECCIEAFIKRNIDDENWIPPNRVQKRVGNGTGFIPCSYCCWKVLTKQCKLEDLINNRKSRKQFPMDDFVYYGKMCK